MPGIEVLVLAPLVTLFAYVVFGISGFGSTLVAIPLLAHLFPIKLVIPTVVLLDCAATIRQEVKLRSGVYRSELVPLLSFMLAGMGAGVFLLIVCPPRSCCYALACSFFSMEFTMRCGTTRRRALSGDDSRRPSRQLAAP